MRNPIGFVREGKAKTKNGLFRIATIQGEYVLVTDRHKVAEYVKAQDTVLNSQDGANDACSLVKAHRRALANRYLHTSVVRGPITRAIPNKTPMMVDEATLAIGQYIGSPSGSSTVPLSASAIVLRLFQTTHQLPCMIPLLSRWHESATGSTLEPSSVRRRSQMDENQPRRSHMSR